MELYISLNCFLLFLLYYIIYTLYVFGVNHYCAYNLITFVYLYTAHLVTLELRAVDRSIQHGSSPDASNQRQREISSDVIEDSE